MKPRDAQGDQFERQLEARDNAQGYDRMLHKRVRDSIKSAALYGGLLVGLAIYDITGGAAGSISVPSPSVAASSEMPHIDSTKTFHNDDGYVIREQITGDELYESGVVSLFSRFGRNESSDKFSKNILVVQGMNHSMSPEKIIVIGHRLQPKEAPVFTNNDANNLDYALNTLQVYRQGDDPRMTFFSHGEVITTYTVS